ncbi:MAG: 30S ribosomal protein THX [Cytophagales bacterium]|nr:30S ribosomal protein THX [Cytophagales bacterium]
MGKGDAKSKKGKRWRGSYGNSRPSKLKNTFKVVAPVVEAATEEKPKASKKKA